MKMALGEKRNYYRVQHTFDKTHTGAHARDLQGLAEEQRSEPGTASLR